MAANVTIFQGNIVREPEFAQTNGPTPILNFTVAHSRKYKQKEDVTFMDCVAYGKGAENIAKFFGKGDPILVTGRLLQNNWQDRDGNKRSKIILTVEQFHFAGPTGNRDGGGNQNQGNQNRNQNQNQGNQNRNQNQNQGGGGGCNNNQNQNNNNQGGRQQGSNQQAYNDDVPF